MLFENFLFALIGLALGSFGNVLIARIHRGSGLSGRSRCMHCHHALGVIDLLPLASYVFLRGRCRFCKRPISLQYPLVELLSLGAFLFALWRHPYEPFQAFLVAIALVFLFFAAVYDYLYQHVPDVFTLIIAIVSLQSLLFGMTEFSIIGASIAFLWFGGQWLLSRGRAVGTGDIFLASALGLWLGFPNIVIAIVLSYIVGSIVLLGLLLFSRISFKKQRIAFVPFLAAGVVLTLLGVGEVYLRTVL